MDKLSVTLLQSELAWENPAENYAHLSALLDNSPAQHDLIVLPEMFTTGFTMRPESQAETVHGPTPEWMQTIAKKHNALVIGSYSCADGGRFFNRLLAVSKTGIELNYDKRHLFSMGTENEHYAAGTERKIIHWKGWKICPMICYDLRFPVWSRNQFDVGGQADYDLLVYVANWPARRAAHWKLLIQARAIENQSYVAGVNRVGNDGNGIFHSGDSAVVDAFGKVLATATHCESVMTQELSLSALNEYRAAFPIWKDADSFSLE
jgi:omega-amidase